MEPLYWASPVPEKCDTCSEPIKDIFYDMATVGGSWGCMCPSCAILGPGIGKLGPGLGQHYERQADGRFLKTAG